VILGGGVAVLFTFVGASRNHLCDSTSFLLYMYGHDCSSSEIKSDGLGLGSGLRLSTDPVIVRFHCHVISCALARRGVQRCQPLRRNSARVSVVTRSVGLTSILYLGQFLKVISIKAKRPLRCVGRVSRLRPP